MPEEDSPGSTQDQGAEGPEGPSPEGQPTQELPTGGQVPADQERTQVLPVPPPAAAYGGPPGPPQPNPPPRSSPGSRGPLLGALAVIGALILVGGGFLIARATQHKTTVAPVNSPSTQFSPSALPSLSPSPLPSPSPFPSPSGAGARFVRVTMLNGRIQLSANKGRAGIVRFTIVNGGTVPHTFVLLKTNRAFNQLPLAPGENKVNDEAPGIFKIDDSSVDPGEVDMLTESLAPGKYVIICNEDGHYVAGERLPFTVVSG